VASRRRKIALASLVTILVGLVAGIVIYGAVTGSDVVDLPVLAGFSLSRLAVAYLLALAFAIAYGHAAATSGRRSAILLPILDVLQAVPILGFFPAAILFFVTITGAHPIGLEFAVVFLIFTSMAWNMAFGVYESLTMVPRDLVEAADSFGLSGSQRFSRLEFPAMVPKLVYNSILSWSNGWFFLVASEIFTAGSATYVRPGLGSFLALQAIEGDVGGIAAGLIMLVTVVLLLDIFVWRPVAVWSERFKLDPTGRAEPTLVTYERLRWLPTFPTLRRSISKVFAPVGARVATASARIEGAYDRHRGVVRTVMAIDWIMAGAIAVLVIYVAVTGLLRFGETTCVPCVQSLPEAAALSLSRLAIGYAIAVAWTLPVAAAIARRAALDRVATPAVEVLAALPATAFFPVVVGIAIGRLGAVDAAVIVLVTLSMQWYLLFNLLAGVKSIPSQFEEAARSYAVRGRLYWRRVLLPALLPSFITGSITAWGAGWNALIIAEYIPFGGVPFQVLGLGALLAEATLAIPSDPVVIVLSIATMVAIVLAMNRLVWRPLYRRSARHIAGEEL